MAFTKVTEQSSLHDNLDQKSVGQLLVEMNEEDQKVALAVKECIPQIEKLVEGIVERMKQGGRIFYMGAGTSGRLGVLDASEIPPTFGMPPSFVIGLIAGGDHALRNPVENAEDDPEKSWKELLEHDITPLDTVVGVKVLRGVDPSLDKEAVRVVSMSPKWKPGKQRDRAVPVTYTFPVIFQLR